MTAYEDDTALLAELLTAYERCPRAGRRRNGNDNAGDPSDNRLSADDERALADVLDHLRALIIQQAAGLRRWRRRHAAMDDPLQRRFSALEGAAARQNLRLHWLLYRRAMRRAGSRAGRGRARLWAV